MIKVDEVRAKNIFVFIPASINAKTTHAKEIAIANRNMVDYSKLARRQLQEGLNSLHCGKIVAEHIKNP